MKDNSNWLWKPDKRAAQQIKRGDKLCHPMRKVKEQKAAELKELVEVQSQALRLHRP